MLLIILQPNSNFQFTNHPIWPPVEMRHQAWKLKVKPNCVCHSNIAITISYISVLFHLDNPKIDELRSFKCWGHPVSLRRWPLTCDLATCYFLRSSLGMYILERRLRYSHLLTRHCPCNLLPERTSPKHEYRGPTLRSPCDIIDDVITMKNILSA